MQTETRVDVSHYSYRAAWWAEDGEFVATCQLHKLALCTTSTSIHSISLVTKAPMHRCDGPPARGGEVDELVLALGVRDAWKSVVIGRSMENVT